ncbi:MAG: hypothetical protein APR62_01310 [Smithella sp. SDB]|nr:MAG: hypothetical protein APR62_01310 [Smithella sp. SDB]
MKELVQPVTFSSLSENEQLLPDAEPYIVTVCLSYNNFPLAGGCSSTVTSEHAGEKLATILLNRYFNGSEPRPFRVVMQSMMTLDHQKQVLQQIEIHAVTIIESRIFKAHGTLIKEYEKISKEEAERGVNWSHKSNDENSIYEFNTKKAFTRLHNIANQEKNLTSNKFINN